MTVMPRSKTANVVGVNLRMEVGLRNRIQRVASANSRSMNSEIVTALAIAYPAPTQSESLNQDLIDASQEVATAWKSVLVAVGQDPLQNEQLCMLLARLKRAQEGGAA